MRRPHRTWPQRLLLTLNIALVVVCLAAAGGVYWTYNQASALPRIDVGASLSPSSEPGEAQNILLVGIDDGSGLEAGDPVLKGRTATLNTDTVMILRVDPQTQQAALLSLPRDLYVNLAGGNSKGRINTALALGGPERLIETIKQDFGIPINHYAMVDFHGFEALVSAVGGVPVYFNYPSRDQKTGLFQYDPGCVTLDGDQALAYARSRHFEIQKTPNGRWQEDPASDLGRITRQQQFIKAALRKAVSTGVRNPFVLKDLVGIAQKNVTLDTEFSIQDLIDLGMQFREFDPDQLQTYQPQVDGHDGRGDERAQLWTRRPRRRSSTSSAGSRPSRPIPRASHPPPRRRRPRRAPPLRALPPRPRPTPPSTTTTLSDFIPQAPEGESCG